MNDLPSCISSQVLTKPVVASYCDVRQCISVNGNIKPGGSAFLLPNSTQNSFMKSGSAFLNFNIALTVSGTGANSVALACGPLGDASALISRVNVSSGQVIENIPYYNVVNQMIMLNKTNAPYVQNDLAALSGASLGATGFMGSTGASLTTQNYNVSTALNLGLFNSCDSMLPLCLLSNLQILVDFESNLNKCFQCQPGVTVTDYTISGLNMTYESINVDQTYVNELKAAMREGMTYNFSATQIQSFATADLSTVSQEFGVSTNSLNLVSWTSYAPPSGSTGPHYYSGGSASNYQLYIDGAATLQGQQADLTARQSFCYALNKNAWTGGLWDPLVSYAVPPNSVAHPIIANDTSSPYASQCFTGAIGIQSYNIAGLVFSGRPASRCRLEIQKQAGGSTSSIYIVAIKDCIYQITSDGSIHTYA